MYIAGSLLFCLCPRQHLKRTIVLNFSTAAIPLFLDTFPGSFIRFIRLPVEVTRTICRNSFLNKFTTIRPPNLWIATRPGRLSHVSPQGLETEQSLSTRFNFNKNYQFYPRIFRKNKSPKVKRGL